MIQEILPGDTLNQGRVKINAMITELYGNIDIHKRGEWNTNDALPTNGSGDLGELVRFDEWVIPDGGWSYGEFTAAKWTILMYMGGDPSDFESFKTY